MFGESPAKVAGLHFMRFKDEQVLDFIEIVLTVNFFVERSDWTVGEINHIFQEEGIGYELTSLRQTEMEDGEIHTEFPQVVRKDTEFLHNEVIRPCLEALRRPGFEVACSEMMKAHEEHRRGEYANAITHACSAFESVMKTICVKKSWDDIDPDKATCSPLAKFLAEKNLFYSFYTPMFEAVGTIRNKISASHGRGPEKKFEPDKEYADHMIQYTSAHITLMVKKSGL